ncbi:glycosyltransferase [Granulicoccus phenolivorans]|uniref:glycosyltransferase n=1 Tax=Granulicoccus phenolivorans TaxID=266854 RepID=UPI0003F8695B|nr:glycosyltransferase [Granulicoccus phenolivorans]
MASDHERETHHDLPPEDPTLFAAGAGRARVDPADWAWAHRDTERAPVDVSTEHVVAIVVAHNGAAWLPAALASLRNLTVQPTYWFGVDTGSTDDTAALMRASGLFHEVHTAPADTSFADATRIAAQHVPGGPDPRHNWLWLLHDDITVAPDALAELLRHVVSDDQVDVTGPMLLQPTRGDDPPRISELGVTITDSGRVDRHLEPGEINQQQYTSQRVLGLNSCGLLVRRPAWEKLDGMAPEIPLFRDGVAFGWAANAAGYKVSTTPEALIVHRQAGTVGLRDAQLLEGSPAATDRYLGMLTVAGHRGRATSLTLILSSLLRALGFLLGKAPDLAADELRALRRFSRSGPQIAALRARYAGLDETRVKGLRPGRWSGLTHTLDAAGRGISDRWQHLVGAHDVDISVDELTGDDFAATTEPPRRRVWINPFTAVVLALIVLALVTARNVIGPGRLTGAMLLPSQPSLAAAYAAYLDPIVGGPGLSAPPWLAWIALGSTLTFGQTEWLISLVVLGCVPLSFLSAYLLGRRVLTRQPVRLAAAVAYALIPALIGAVNRGAIGVAVVAVVLPLLIRTLVSLVARVRAGVTGPDSWRAAWGAGALLTILTCFLPLLWVAAVLLAVLGCLLVREKALIQRAAVALGVPVVLLAPWWPSLLNGFSRIALGPDAGIGRPDAGAAVALLVGRSPGEGLPPLWLSIALAGLCWLAALAALALQPRGPLVLGAWFTAVVALVFAVGTSGLLATALPAGTRVRPEVLTWLLLAFGALVFAIAVAADSLGVPGRAASRRILSLAAAVVLLGGVVGATGWWVAHGTAPLTRTQSDALPPYVRNAMAAPAYTRTLAIDLTGEPARWELLDGAGNRLGDADRGLAFGGSASLPRDTANLVTRLLAGTADDTLAGDLTALQIGHLWVHGADIDQRARIQNTPGLGPGTAIEGDRVLWTVPGSTGRVVLRVGDQETPQPPQGHLDLPVATQSRQLVLHQPADPRLRVSFDGDVLPVRTAGAISTVEIPPGAGRLEYGISTPVRPWLIAGQLIGLVVVCVLAAPALRRQDQEPAPVGRRVAEGGRR